MGAPRPVRLTERGERVLMLAVAVPILLAAIVWCRWVDGYRAEHPPKCSAVVGLHGWPVNADGSPAECRP